MNCSSQCLPLVKLRGYSQKNLFVVLADMIGEENCVVIGRCGNYIFRERKDLVSVFLRGDLEARIEEIQEEQGLSY